MDATEKRAIESETWFQTLLDSAPDAMVIVNADGEIATVNNQALAMFGYDRAELQGHKIEKLMPAELRSRHEAHRANYVADPKVRLMGVGLELLAQRKNGDVFPVEISLSPVQLESAFFVSSVIRDVSERKKMEREIIAARREAERANRANSAFLAAASHDLRQPVQALSLLNGALRRTVTDSRALEMIDHQEHSLTAMTNLLNSLLDISRLDGGAIQPELEDFPMQQLIDRLSAEFARQAHQKGLEFSAESCGARVRSDPNLLGEIIQNLVSNAIRYTDKGSVRLRCVESGNRCEIRVEDTGVGIEADEIDRIFEEFHQVKMPGATKEGFGLGLAIVRRLTDLLGHEVAVESTPGEGSCFTLAVPVLDAAAPPERVPAAEDQAVVGHATGVVVLIEDDTNVANAWSLLLLAEGFEVEVCASVADVRTLIGQLGEQPVLLVSDFYLLDGSTGVEAVSMVRRHYDAEIPAFIVTGDTSKIVTEARLLDNCALLSKPVNAAQMLAAAKFAASSGQVPSS